MRYLYSQKGKEKWFIGFRHTTGEIQALCAWSGKSWQLVWIRYPDKLPFGDRANIRDHIKTFIGHN